jgi:MFS family permease
VVATAAVAAGSAVPPPERRLPPTTAREPGWRGARRLLEGSLRTLVTGQTLVACAGGVVQIAFAQFVLFDVGQGSTPARIALVLATTLLPFSVVGPAAGVVIDRWPRRRALIVTSLLQAGLAIGSVATIITRSEAAAFVGMLLLLSISRFAAAAKGAALPRTVRTEELVTANGISAVAGMSGAFVGAVGGAAFVGRSPAAGFVIGALLYLVAAAAYTRLPDVGGGGAGGDLLRRIRSAQSDFVDGLRTAATTAEIRRPLAAMFVHRVLLGGGFVLLVLIADSKFHMRIAGYGLTLAVTGVGAFAGSVLAPVSAQRWRPVALLPLAFVPPAIASDVGALAPSFGVLVVGIGVTAAAFQVLKVLVDAMVGAATPDLVRGRVFAAYDALYNVAFVVAALLMVPLWSPGSARTLLWGLGAAFVLGWLLFARVLGDWPFAPRRHRPAA